LRLSPSVEIWDKAHSSLWGIWLIKIKMAKQKQTFVRTAAVPAGPRLAAVGITLTPKEIYGILRRHVLLIVSLTVLGFVLGVVSWYLMLIYAPKYTAQTFIKVLPPLEKDPMVLGGGQVGMDIQYGHRASMAALIQQQRTLEELIARDKIQQTKWFNRFGDIKSKKIVKAIEDLKKHFSANAQRDGDYIVVSMTYRDKEEATLIVNEMVDLFINSQKQSTKSGVSDRMRQLTDQRDAVQAELDWSERAIEDTRKTYNVFDLGRETYYGDTTTIKLNDLEVVQSDLVLKVQDTETLIKNLEQQATGPITNQIEQMVETDPVMVMLAQQLYALESQLMGKLAKFGEDHRVVRDLQELIDAVKEKREARKVQIAEQTRQANLKNAQDELAVQKSRLEELQRMRQEVETKKREIDLARTQYDKQVAIRDERRQMLDGIKEQLEKLKIMHGDPETPKVQFIGYAPVPLDVSSPLKMVYFPGGTVLGGVFGVGLVFLIELLNDLVRTPKDVALYLNIPLLGIIPDAAEDENLRDVDLCHVVRQAPYSVVSESYRRLRTNLTLSDTVESLKVLLVTAGMAGDGKTSVAVNLATTFVAENKKALLIDANFRRPSLHTIFPKAQPRQPREEIELGLSNLLLGQVDCQQVIRPSGIGGLDVIDAGPLPFNPAELLGGERMDRLIKDQHENYDYIILDSPPVLLVSDAKILAKFADGTILVFNAGATRRGAALRTIRELRQVNATILGCVILAAKALKGGYFEEQFRFYQEYQKLQLAHPI
jgi:capsular exopolysaccharide synthesis family protein